MTEEEFNKLADQWEEDTQYSSKIQVEHPIYQRICKEAKIEYIFRRLETKPNWWFYALRELSGEDPMKEEHTGKFDLILQDWFEWWSKRLS